MSTMVWLCLVLLVVAFAVSLPLTWWLIGVGHRRGWVDRPGSAAHKAHARAVPTTGGTAIVASIALPTAACLALVWVLPATAWTGWLAPVAEHVEGLRRQTPMAVAVLAALAIIHVMGLIDDRRSISAGAKLAIEAAVALVLCLFFDMRVLTLLDQHGPAGVAASAAISVVWIVAVTNAMNFMDNMDGLAGGVGAIIGGLYLAATLISGQWFVAAWCAVLLGALGGFLVYNVAPARVFMGDAGSLVLGLFLAIISVRTTYFIAPAMAATAVTVPAVTTSAAVSGHPGQWHGLLMPLVVMAVPLYDMLSAIAIRLAQGRNPLVADRQHFSHRLVRRGLRPPAAVAVIWLCTLATGLGGVMLGSLKGWQAALVAVQTLSVLLLLALLESGSGGGGGGAGGAINR